MDAVDLRTGELLWETAEAQRPLLLWGPRLIAQAGLQRNRPRILLFDLTQNGACVLESDPVVLSDWVVASNAPGRSFDAQWRLDRNQLVLAWEASAWHAGPTRPTPKQEAAERKHAVGTARIDLDTGRVEQGPAEGRDSPPSDPIPQLDKKSVRWQGMVGKCRCAVLLEEVGGQQAFMLRSWDTASWREGECKELLRGKRLLLQATLDAHLFLVRDAGFGPDEKKLGAEKSEQFWDLIAPELASPLARLPYEPGTQAVAVVGLRAYYSVAGTIHGRLDRPLLQPRILKAYDLKAAKPLWQRPVAGNLLAPPTR
jgi:hypothetical protein